MFFKKFKSYLIWGKNIYIIKASAYPHLTSLPFLCQPSGSKNSYLYLWKEQKWKWVQQPVTDFQKQFDMYLLEENRKKCIQEDGREQWDEHTLSMHQDFADVWKFCKSRQSWRCDWLVVKRLRTSLLVHVLDLQSWMNGENF